jgi:hypothetical protein
MYKIKSILLFLCLINLNFGCQNEPQRPNNLDELIGKYLPKNENDYKFETGIYNIENSLVTGMYGINPKNLDRNMINKTPFINIKNFKKLEYDKNSILITLDEEGKRILYDTTSKYVNETVVFIINDNVVFTPIVKGAISVGKLGLPGENKEQQMAYYFYLKDEMEKINKGLSK